MTLFGSGRRSSAGDAREGGSPAIDDIVLSLWCSRTAALANNCDTIESGRRPIEVMSAGRSKVGEHDGKQRVWIVRYGLTADALVEDVGPFDSDLDSGDGMDHAKGIAGRIAPFAPAYVYTSPFLRTCRTAHIIAEACKTASDKACSVRVHDGLTEWQIPSLLINKETQTKTEPRSVQQLAGLFLTTIDPAYKPTSVPTLKFPETEEDLIQRCSEALDSILSECRHDSFAIVSHAPCDQALALNLERVPERSSSQVVEWPLGGVTMFERSFPEAHEGGSSSPWKLAYYGGTEHMPGDYKNGLKHWSLPCLRK